MISPPVRGGCHKGPSVTRKDDDARLVTVEQRLEKEAVSGVLLSRHVHPAGKLVAASQVVGIAVVYGLDARSLLRQHVFRDGPRARRIGQPDIAAGRVSGSRHSGT